MALRDLDDRSAVLRAMAEADELGEETFLRKYGFEPSRRFRIFEDGRSYPSKAVLAAAHGVQFPDRGPLASSDFSGGQETVAKARALGFEVEDMDVQRDDLGIALVRFMELYREGQKTSFGHGHPAVEALRACAALIERLLPDSLAGALVRPSVGQGNWAAIPWIAVLHPEVTSTTQHGVYPVLLFHEDLQAVEVTIAQGVTDLKMSLGRREAVRELDHRSRALRGELTDLVQGGFRADANYQLGSSALGRDYVASTVVHRRFDAEDLPTSTVTVDVRAALEAYGKLMASGALRRVVDADSPTPGRHALMIYVGRGAGANFESGGRQGWWGWKEAPSGLETLRPGDLVAFGRGFDGGSPRVDESTWRSHSLREVVVGRVITPPERTDQRVMPDELSGEASYPWKLRFDRLGTEAGVELRPGLRLSAAASEGLRRSAITRGIGVPVPIVGSPLLESFMGKGASAEEATTEAVAAAGAAFASAIEDSGLRLPPHEISAFLAALMAKPFAILTGQSGSGKTQLAKRLGEWFGADDQGRPRYLAVPVRPDWTGPEYLFGYPDALRSGAGKEVWAVPDALEFMLRAAGEPDAPYLLLLDEMNLAHVERYFADYISGVESRDQVLPELRRQDGIWTATGNSQRLPLPRNLFVVGTVNVDETTYLFSPKVLDRAFTFEFRTAAADLDPTLRRPVPVTAGDRRYRDLFVRVAADDSWQHEHPHAQLDGLVEDLRTLHDLLRPSGYDFGHRILYESLRYAALLGAMGVDDRRAVLDRLVLTKLLPKMHGTRARLEKPLRELRAFAQGAAEKDQQASMPLTAHKLDRMITVLLEAQFVSFTE